MREARAGGVVHSAGAGMERSGTGLNWRSQAPNPADVSLEAASGDSSAVQGFPGTALPHLSPVPVGVSNVSAREEITDDLFGRTNADLNVIQFAEAGGRIQGASLQEKAASRVERFFAFLLAQPVERFNHRAVKTADLQVCAVILRRGKARGGTDFEVSLMGVFYEGQRFGIGEVQAVPQVNHRAQDGGGFDFASVSSSLRLRPAQGSGGTVLPKVNTVPKPVPGIFTWFEFGFPGDNPPGQTSVATVIADGKRVGKHQRNWGFNLPLAVYMPMANKNRMKLFAKRQCASRFAEDPALPLSSLSRWCGCLRTRFSCKVMVPHWTA